MKDEYKGLNEKEISIMREKYGENKLTGAKKRGFFKMLLGNLNDPIIKVLSFALVINIVFTIPHVNIVESIGILTSILIATLVSTISEFSSENAFERLRDSSEKNRALVKRDGDVSEIDQCDIVVGDILILEAGNGVYADCYIINGEISLNEASLTGESNDVYKTPLNSEERNALLLEIKTEKISEKSKGSQALKGSLVTSGYAESIVTSVGEDTYLGKEAKKLSCAPRPSPLKNRLSHLAKTISIIGYVAAVVVALAYLFNSFVIEAQFVPTEIFSRLSNYRFVISKLISSLTLAISITVVAVPEGLPMMITVVLSSNMKKMARDNVLVRKMVGIETSGNINLLFTDKTGTITEGVLRLKEYVGIDGREFTKKSIKDSPIFNKYLTLCAYFCTNASKNQGKIVGGDATEQALLSSCMGEKPKCEIIEKLPFDSAKKYSAASLRCGDGQITIFKGAPEKILGASNTYLEENGEPMTMTGEKLAEIRKKLSELSSLGYRVLGIGVKIGKTDTSLEKITFLCLAVFKDRIRKEVKKAVSEIKGAGVSIVMITGDSRETAEAIAKECGIISPYSRGTVLEAEQLHKMTDSEVKSILPTLSVVSRALPSDKHRLVTLSQECGYVVGMTGDGINDASSLKASDVGFAMGTGTEVAKEAGDIVIKDNNLASISKAILYGRTIFESIRKFVIFQLIMNFSAVGISILGPFIGVSTPVTITQMLWVNIIMDTLGALAFACEPPIFEYMKRPPKKPSEKILTRKIIKHIALTSAFILILCVWFLKSENAGMILHNGTEKYLLSAFFAVFVFTGVFVCFTVRTNSVNILKGITKNPMFVVIMGAVLVVQVFFIYFGGEVLRTVPLKAFDLFSVMQISFSVVVFDVLRKISGRIFKIKKRKKAIILKGKIQ